MRDSRILIAGLIFACLLAAIWYVQGMYQILQTSTFTDFGVFFHAGERLASGVPMYQTDEMRALTFAPVYKYPPLWASLLQFFAPVGFRNTALSWLLISQFLYFGSLAALCRLFRFRFHTAEFYFLLLTFLFFQPTLDSMNGPQMDALFLAAVVVTWWGIAADRPTLSGAPIAFLAAIKITPGFLALHFLIRRRWKAFAAFIAVFAFLGLCSLALAGWESHREYLLHALPASIGSTAYVENQSLFGVIARFFVPGSSYEGGKATVLPAAKWITIAVSLLLIAINLVAVGKSRREDTAYASWIPLLLLILPFSWTHYEVILLFPLAVLLHHQRNSSAAPAGWVLLILAYLLLAVGTPESVPTRFSFAYSYKFCGVFIVWILTIRAMAESREEAPREEDMDLRWKRGYVPQNRIL